MKTGITSEPLQPAPGESWEIEYVLTEEDYHAFSLILFAPAWNRNKNVPLRFANPAVLWVSGCLLLCLGIVIGEISLGVIHFLRVYYFVANIYLSLLILSCGFLTFLAFIYFARNHDLKVITGAGFQPNRRDRVIFAADGFVERTSSFQSDDGTQIREDKEFRVSWSAVESIAVTPTLVLINVRAKGFLIVPSSAFADTVARGRFVEAIDRLKREAFENADSGPPAGE